jgi:hypothetical protein
MCQQLQFGDSILDSGGRCDKVKFFLNGREM